MAVMLEKYLAEIYNAMRTSGVFLTSGDSSRANTAAISWGAFGQFWNRPMAIIPIREARFTYGLILQHGVFSVSVPRKDLSKELAAAGAISGRHADKFSELHLHPAKARRINTYIVADCGLHLECRLIYRVPVTAEHFSPAIDTRNYVVPENRHSMFYGEILDLYET